MNFKLFGGSLSALLLAAALTGCSPSSSGSGAGSSTAGGDTIATVGSSSVTRAQLAQTLEGLYGDQVLPQLIDSQLLSEALKAKNGTVSDAEVDAELARIEEQDPNVKATLDNGGARVEVVKNQLRRNLTVQKLLTEGITADPAKEKAFFNTYSSYYGTPTQNRLGLLAASTKTRADQLERALKAKPDSFASLVEEQKKSKDQVAVQLSNADLGRFESPADFGSSFVPPQLLPQIAPSLAPIKKALATAKKGQVLPAQPLTPRGPFLIVRVIDRKEATKPDFAKVQSQVETDYKMGAAALVAIKKNPQNPPKLEDNIKGEAQLLSQQAPPGTRLSLRDILTAILRPESNNLLDKLRTGGTVQIADPAFKEVAKGYLPPTAPAGATGNTATENSAAGNSAATTTTNSAAPAKP